MKRRKSRKPVNRKSAGPPTRIGGGALRASRHRLTNDRQIPAAARPAHSGNDRHTTDSLSAHGNNAALENHRTGAPPVDAVPAGLSPATAATTAASTPTTRIRLLTWKRIVLAVLILAASALAIALYAVSRPPNWYAMPVVQPADQQSVRDDLERMTDRFSMALLGSEAFEICFSDAQLTRWVTARAAIWPAAEQFIPADWSGAMLRFEVDRVIVAARYAGMRQAPVVSLELGVSCDGSTITVRPITLCIGSLGLPVSWMTRWTRELRLAERAAEEGLQLTGSVAEGFSVSARQRWWNGRRNFVVQAVHIVHGELCATITPLGGPR